MRFALVDNIRMEAEPGLKGICPGCSQPVIAKCGEKKIKHWAHKRMSSCDNWWETETQWHRDWKDNFPKECQEVFMHESKSGEKHVADVKTEHGLVIEFQHSHIDPKEQRAREAFYKDMIWIVDGTRLKRDYPRFCKWIKNDLDCFTKTSIAGVYFMSEPEWWFQEAWINSTVLVVFDFGEQEYSVSPDGEMIPLVWCLLPGRVGQKAVVVKGSKEGLINNLNTSIQPLPWTIDKLKKHFNEELRVKKEKERQEVRYYRSRPVFRIKRKRRRWF